LTIEEALKKLQEENPNARFKSLLKTEMMAALNTFDDLHREAAVVEPESEGGINAQKKLGDAYRTIESKLLDMVDLLKRIKTTLDANCMMLPPEAFTAPNGSVRRAPTVDLYEEIESVLERFAKARLVEGEEGSEVASVPVPRG